MLIGKVCPKICVFQALVDAKHPSPSRSLKIDVHGGNSIHSDGLLVIRNRSWLSLNSGLIIYLAFQELR